VLPLVVFCCGCPFTPPGTNGSGVPVLDKGSNGTLATATSLPLGNSDEATFAGRIDAGGDVDVYHLGTLSPGDRLTVDVQTTSGDLDPVAAIFDSREDLIAFNDDRTPDGSNLNPFLDIVLRGDAGTYYLGIIAYPDSTTTGDYQVTVQIQRGVGVPSPEAQIVFLDWKGGPNIVVPNVGTFDLPPFSATDVGLAAPQTAALKDRVQQVVAQRYAAFDFILLNSDDDAVPSQPHSTVYFGGDNPQAFAISEQIDTFNADPSDRSIVFTASYRTAFTHLPTFEEMAQALGNTVAHEVGHLLGLVHTADCNDLMDTSCFNDRILSPQAFDTGKLDSSVFPFGWQPEVDILDWLLGLAGS
jgi:hypothetical protein